MSPRELFLTAYRAHTRVAVVGALTETAFLRAAVKATCQYDLCPFNQQARWVLAQSLFDDFTATTVTAALDSATGQRVVTGRGPHEWLGGLLELVHQQGWEKTYAVVSVQGALALQAVAGVRGSFVLLRGSLYPEFATERPMMTAIAKSKLHGELTCFPDVYRIIRDATGDDAATIDRVLLEASRQVGWWRAYSAEPDSGNQDIDQLSYFEKSNPRPKGLEHVTGATLQQSSRGSTDRRSYRSGY